MRKKKRVGTEEAEDPEIEDTASWIKEGHSALRGKEADGSTSKEMGPIRHHVLRQINQWCERYVALWGAKSASSR